MQTGADNNSVYISNIKDITDGTYFVDRDSDEMSEYLYSVMQGQPIYDIPKHFIVESH